KVGFVDDGGLNGVVSFTTAHGGAGGTGSQRCVFVSHASDHFQLLLSYCHGEGALAAADVVLKGEDEQRGAGERSNHHHDERDGCFEQREAALVVGSVVFTARGPHEVNVLILGLENHRHGYSLRTAARGEGY